MNSPIFQSATRVVLLMLVVALVSITSYGAISFEDKRFDMVFALFKDVTLLVAGAFFMKSTQEKQEVLKDERAVVKSDELLDTLSE